MRYQVKRLSLPVLFVLAVLVWSITASAAGKVYTIENVSADYAIEADVTLSGSGTGYHAKLLVCTPTAATSFGIQLDKYTRADYAKVPAFMIENVRSNAAGGQSYYWVGKGKKGQSYRLMLAFKKKSGKVTVYIDGKKVKSVKNPSLKKKNVFLRVEASARKKKDKVTAVFSNIKLKKPGKYKKTNRWSTTVFDTNKGIKSDVSRFQKKDLVVISGKIKGISSKADWDSAYANVSGVVQFRG